jgi:hypothetical protein
MIRLFFAMFASDNEHIALMVNNMTSVVSSAFTIIVLVFVDDFEKINLKNSCTKSKEDKALN